MISRFSRGATVLCLALLVTGSTSACSIRWNPQATPEPPLEALDLRDRAPLPEGWKEWHVPLGEGTFALPEDWKGKGSLGDPEVWYWSSPNSDSRSRREVTTYEKRSHTGSAVDNEHLEIVLDPREFSRHDVRRVSVDGAKEAAVLERNWTQEGPDGRALAMEERQIRVLSPKDRLVVVLIRGPEKDFAPGGVLQRVYDSYQLDLRP